MARSQGVSLREVCVQSKVSIAAGYEKPLEGVDFSGVDYVLFMSDDSTWFNTHMWLVLEPLVDTAVSYSRWEDEFGEEFPYSPFDSHAYLEGLDFVGTDVGVRAECLRRFQEKWPGLQEVLAELARDGAKFTAVDAVTYVKGG